MKIRTFCLFSIAVWFGIGLSADPLFDLEKAIIPIVVYPAQATPQERFAAQEMADLLREITKKPIRCKPENTIHKSDSPLVFIGRTNKAKALLSDNLPQQEEHWVIGGDGCSSQIIVGGGKRGTIYGVYEFFDRLGMRFITPEETIVPALSSIPLSTEFEFGKPKTERRYFAWNANAPVQWKSRMRLNGISASLPDYMGGHYKEASGGDCHYLSKLVPFTMFDEKPQWFAMNRDGQRLKGDKVYGAPYCTTNQELRDYVVKRVREELDRTQAQEIWIGQSDGQSAGCYCEKCRLERKPFVGYPEFAAENQQNYNENDPLALARDNELWAANNILFANYIADEVGKTHPGVKLLTLAYSYTSFPPQTPIRIADNLVVNISGPNGKGICCWFHGYTPGEAFQISAWRKQKAHIRMYTYGASNYGFWWPFPNIVGHMETYNALYKDGVREFFDQGSLGGAGHPPQEASIGSGFIDLRMYISARILWNPELDPEIEIREFCNAYYGAAGKAIADYIFWYDKYTRKQKIHGDHCWGKPFGLKNWVNSETIAQGRAFEQTALQSVTGNKRLTQRVQTAFQEVNYAEMLLGVAEKMQVRNGRLVYLQAGKEAAVREAARKFIKVMRDNGYARLSEVTLYREKESAPDFFLRDDRVYRLGDKDTYVEIAPALAGRIVNYHAQEVRLPVYKLPEPLVPYQNMYETYFSPPENYLWRYWNFDVKAYEPGKKLILQANDKKLEVIQSFAWNNNGLDLSITVKNQSTDVIQIPAIYRPILDNMTFQKSVTVQSGEKTISASSGKRRQDLFIKVAPDQAGSIIRSFKNGKYAHVLSWEKGIGKVLSYHSDQYQEMCNFDYASGELFLNDTNLLPGATRSWQIREEIIKCNR